MGPRFGSSYSAGLSHIEALGPLVGIGRHATKEEVDRRLMEHSLGLVGIARVAVLALGAAELLREEVGAARGRTER